MMAERGLLVDHTTLYRWVQQYAPNAPILEKRCRAKLKSTNDCWRVDETYIKVKGQYRAQLKAISGARSGSYLPPSEWLLRAGTSSAATRLHLVSIKLLQHSCRQSVLHQEVSPFQKQEPLGYWVAPVFRLAD